MCNLGELKSNQLLLNSSSQIDNHGEIAVQGKLHITGSGTTINHGRLSSTTGTIDTECEKFEQIQGELISRSVKLASKQSVINGIVRGQEIELQNAVTNNGTLDFQKGSIAGALRNNGQANFSKLLQLSGDRSTIDNHGTINNEELIANSKVGLISGGQINSQRIKVKQHLQANTNFKSLKSIDVAAPASLLLQEGSNTRNLQNLNNRGKARILSSTPKLEKLQNCGHLQLENDSEIPASLDNLRGTNDIRAKFSNVSNMRINAGTTINFKKGSQLPEVKEIVVQNGASLNLDEGVTDSSKVSGLYNFGTTTINSKFGKLDAIYNGNNAALHLLQNIKIGRRKVTKDDRKIISKNLPSDISLLNDGKVLIKTQEQRFVTLEGDYVASNDAILRLDKGGIRANKFMNDGIIYSPDGLKVTQHSNNSQWGRCVAEKFIEYNAKGTELQLGGRFQPIIQGNDKKLKINAERGTKVVADTNMNVDLDISSPTMTFEGDLTARSLKANTNEFSIKKAEKKKITVSAKENFDITTRNFTNDGGRLQTQGSKKSNLNVSGQFKNTGGGRITYERDPVTWYSFDDGKLTEHNSEVYHTVYKPHLDKAGVITTGGLLDINAKEFDNSFGIINAAKGLNINLQRALHNECGLIYSGGTTYLNGAGLYNGYVAGSKSFYGVNPNEPVYERRPVPYQVRIQSGYHYRSGSWPFRHTKWCDTSHWETRYRDEDVIVGYKPKTSYSFGSRYPGYIFSVGDLKIDAASKPSYFSSSYFGTIVSGGNIFFKGHKQETLNSYDIGKLIARGNVNLELRKAALDQLAIQAQNIFMNLIKDLTIRGIISPILLPTGQVVQLIDLQKFGKQLGFLTDNSTFRQQGDARKTVTTLLPMGLSSSTEPSVSIYNTHSSGFMGEAPKSSFFASSVHDSIINQLLLLTLTPIYGRDILLRIDLIERLVKTGAKIADSVRGSREIVLPGGNPAILFNKSLNPDIEMEVDGQKVMVPLYNPYLLTDTLSRVINKIQAEKLIAIKTLGNIKLAPGEMNLDSEDLSLKAQKQIEIAAEFQYSPYGRVGVDPVVIEQRGKFEAEGKEGVFSRGANITAKSIKLRSSEGNVVDSEMPLDMNYKFSWGSVTGEQKTITSVFTGNGIEFSAPNGIVEQHGTDLLAGAQGVMFEGKYDWQPAYQKSFYATSNRKGMTTSETQVPKPGGIQSTGGIIFKSKDATLAGATIVTSKISYPEDGDLTFNPAYVEQKNHSVTIKNGLFGSSKAEFVQDRSIPVGAKILADKFEALGMGKLEMVDVTGQILDAVIEKTLIERAAYETNHTVITQHSSGFFAPKINGDVFINALENANKVVTFGDALPTAFNVVGSGVKTLAHAEMMLNLSKMENPMLTLSKIFLGRFVTGFGYSNVRTTIKIDEKRPHQSQMKIGLLRISNDRTHLEGIWDIEGKGTIKTEKFTTQAPKHEVKQEVKTSGYSITFSPDSFLTACFSPQAMVGAMPNVSVIEMESRSQLSENIAQVINADDLFVRCDDAVFNGSQIRARLIDAIVTNDLTIEDLRNEFRSESHDQSIGVELSGIASMIHNVDLGIGFGDPRLKAIPRIRFAEEHELSRRVQNLASLVGTEKFYLTVGKSLYKRSAEVGLRPDGVVVKSDAEKISAGKILEEKLSETHEHDRRVINPCTAEFINMISEVDALQQLRQQISRTTYNQAMNEGMTDVDARALSEANAEAFEEDVANLQQEVDDLKQFVQKSDKAPKQKSTKQAEKTAKAKRQKSVEPHIESVLPFGIVASEDTSSVHGMIASALLDQPEVSPRDQVQAFIPQNNLGHVIKKLTFARYRLEQLAEAYPTAAEYVGNVFMGGVYVLQGAEYAGAFMLGGPAGVGAKYAQQEGMSYLIEHGIDESSRATAAQITTDPTLQQEFAETIKLVSYAALCAGTIKGGKKIIEVVKSNRAIQRKIGNMGKFRELTDKQGGSSFNDGKQAHHMPAQRYLENYELDSKEGLAIIMTDAQHAKTRTFKGRARNIDLQSSYRDELARDIKDVKRILKEDGSWTPDVRQSVLQGLDNFRNEFPQLFEKVKK